MNDLTHYNQEGSTLRKAQLRMLEILIEIDKICQIHNINYWLDGGTLLGAVRHGGFIPWDDDMDICVFRKDYKRFRKVMQEELPDRFAFVDWTTDKYYFDYCARIKDKNSLFDYPTFRKQQYQGVCVDVAIIEKVSLPVKKILDITYWRVFRQLHNVNATKNLASVNFAKKIIAFSLLPIVYPMLIFGRIIGRFSKKSIYAHYGNKIYGKRTLSDILPLKDVLFEKIHVNSMNCAENYLTSQYGAYMQLPPEKDRCGHNVKIEVY